MIYLLDTVFFCSIILNSLINVYLLIRERNITKAARKIIDQYDDDVDELSVSFHDVQQDVASFQNLTDRRISDVLIALKAVEISLEKRDAQIFQNNADLNRSFLELRESLMTTKPMKSNNWDSVREAFKGTGRIEINE